MSSQQPTQPQSFDLLGQREARIENVKQLRALGIDPYPSKAIKDHTNEYVKNNFEKLENKSVTVAGRMTARRIHGKLIFGDILDQSDKLQFAISQNMIQEDLKTGYLGWEHLKLIDIGDIVQITGEIRKTQQGEVTVFATHFKLLTKSILPLPTELTDKETIFRKRYLDLILHPENKLRFQKTAELTFAIREFLNKNGYLEIKTPFLQPVYGGGLAKPFNTKVNALDVDFYLAISHELYLKRLITAGFEKVYNITGYFRNEGIDRTHNPEFSMLETMSAYANYEDNMNLIEEMYAAVSKKVFDKTTFNVNGKQIDFNKTWKRIRMIDAVRDMAGVNFNTIKTVEDAHKTLTKLNIEDRPNTWGDCLVKVFAEKVEHQLVEPTFITNHPVEISPLAKRDTTDPRFVERFEIYIGGIEGGDNWTELNDPQELFERFKDQADKRAHGNDETQPMDVDFLEMMEYGMPPTSGLGPGIERLAMMLTETEYIDDVLFFPMMKPAQYTKFHKVAYGVKDANSIPEMDKPELFSIDPEVKAKWPSLSVGFAIIRGVKIDKSNEELEKEKVAIQKELSALTTEELNSFPEIVAYRKMYKEMGVDWHSRRPSPEALLRRIATKKGLYTVNTAVDAANIVVIRNKVSVGVFDVDKINFPTMLRFGKAGDEIHLLGDEKPTEYKATEIGYFDKKGGYNLDYNYRDSERTAVTTDTTDMLINVDGISEISPETVEEVLREAITTVTKYCGGKVEIAGIVK